MQLYKLYNTIEREYIYGDVGMSSYTHYRERVYIWHPAFREIALKASYINIERALTYTERYCFYLIQSTLYTEMVRAINTKLSVCLYTESDTTLIQIQSSLYLHAESSTALMESL
jgi:hypothetical protein